jgi:hypothetical protein
MTTEKPQSLWVVMCPGWGETLHRAESRGRAKAMCCAIMRDIYTDKYVREAFVSLRVRRATPDDVFMNPAAFRMEEQNHA